MACPIPNVLLLSNLNVFLYGTHTLSDTFV